MVSTGEQVTIALTSMALMELGVKARSYTGGQVKILTDNAHTKARILNIDEAPTCATTWPTATWWSSPASRARTSTDNITTLGRGGSDTTAVAMAAALKADECHIYTDVDGVYTTDPRIEPDARRLKTITFEEMLEMASLGSKVLQIRSVEFAGKYKVRLRVLSSFEEEGEGTLITFEEDEKMEAAVISGIAFNRDEAKITVIGVPDRPGIAYQILGPIADANIDVDMIIQNVGVDGITDFSFTVHRNDYAKALADSGAGEGAHQGARGDRRRQDREGVGGGRRHALARRHREQDVPRAGRRGHQHPDDLDLRDQDLRGGRREVHGARGARAAQGFRARSGAGAAFEQPARERLYSRANYRRHGREVEGAPLLREYTGKTRIEGSNPSVSANHCIDTTVGCITPRSCPPMRCSILPSNP